MIPAKRQTQKALSPGALCHESRCPGPTGRIAGKGECSHELPQAVPLFDRLPGVPRWIVVDRGSTVSGAALIGRI